MAKKIKTLFVLHILLMVYSTSGIFAKYAGMSDAGSPHFFLCYGLMLVVLAIYALGWQQILKRVPLTTAFSNKAVTVVWGIIWGLVFFGESVTPLKIVGAVIVILGVVIYTREDAKTLTSGDEEALDLSELA